MYFHPPIANGQTPAAMRAALPLDDPPVYRFGSTGLSAVPVLRFRPVTPRPISCIADLPISTAPMLWRATTTGALSSTFRLIKRWEVGNKQTIDTPHYPDKECNGILGVVVARPHVLL